MNYLMIMFIGIALITAIGYIFSKSKFVFWIETVCIIIIIGGYSGNIDLVHYRNRYELEFVSNQLIEKLYDILAMFFHKAGLSFEIFHLLLSAISVILISYVVFKLSPRPAFVMSCMMGFSTIEYGIQLQALCASSITIFAIYYLFISVFEKQKAKNRLIYLVLITIACGFHFVSVFFYILLLLPYVKTYNLKYWLVMGITFLLLVLPNAQNFLIKYAVALGNYLGDYRSFSVVIGMCIWQLCGLFIIEKIYCRIKYEGGFSLEKNKTDLKYNLIAEYIYKGSLLMTLVLPFYLFTVVAIRILRTWSVFYYILVTYVPVKKGYLSWEKLGLVLYGIGSFVLFYVILPWGEETTVLKDILTYNIFWNIK